MANTVEVTTPLAPVIVTEVKLVFALENVQEHLERTNTHTHSESSSQKGPSTL